MLEHSKFSGCTLCHIKKEKKKEKNEKNVTKSIPSVHNPLLSAMKLIHF